MFRRFFFGAFTREEEKGERKKKGEKTF